MEQSRSVRRALLLRRTGRHRDVAEGAGQLGRVEAAPSLRPVLGRKLEVAVPGPLGHHVDDVAEVSLGVEAVELAEGDQGEDVGRSLGVVVAAE